MEISLTTWRMLLEQLIKDPHERKRIANALGVTQATLMRWVRGEGHPRLSNLHRLPNAVPAAYAKTFRDLLTRDVQVAFDKLPEREEDNEGTVPPALYRQVLNYLAVESAEQSFWSVCRLVLGQAVEQLDPHRQGIALTVLQCVPPSEGNFIRSLYTRQSQGTPRWTETTLSLTLFFGVETLSGYVLTTGHAATVADTKDPQERQLFMAEDERRSLAAYPIQQMRRVAGVLSAVGTQPHFFTSARLALLEQYSHLIALAFDSRDFYPPEQIQLSVMPPFATQLPVASTLRQRAVLLIQKQRGFSWKEAERVALQQMESELLQMAAAQTNSFPRDLQSSANGHGNQREAGSSIGH